MNDMNVNEPRCWICGRTEDELKTINPPARFIKPMLDYQLCSVCRWIIFNAINSNDFGLVQIVRAHADAIEKIETEL